MTETAAAIVRQLLLFTALLAPLELLAPARARGYLRKGLFTDLTYFVVAPFIVKAGAAALLAGAALALGWLVPPSLRALLQAQPWAVQLAEIVVASEVAGYWLHRWSHEWAWLWRFHAVHHSNQELDFLAAHRQHPLEAIWLLAAANLPVLALGFSMEPLLWFVLAQKLYTAFLHANVRIGYGRFGVLLASPQFHHWHHDGRPGAPAKNFASTLPLLDKLWGTYAAPAGFPERYGIDEPMAPDLLGQLAHPFR